MLENEPARMEDLRKKKLTLRYMVSLGFIALLAVANFIFNQQEVAYQANHAELINIVGRQRMLVQGVVRDLLAQKAIRGQISTEMQSVARNLKTWDSVQKKLISGEYTILINEESHKELLQKLQEMEPLREQLRDSLERWLSRPESLNARSLAAILARTDQFVDSMNLLLEFLEEDVTRHIDQHYRGELYILLSYFILLGVIILFVFQPMVHNVRQIYERLSNSNQKLAESGERLKKAQEVAHMGYWNWEIATGEMEWSDEAYRVFGYKPGEINPSYESFLEAIHPEDRAFIIESIDRSLFDPQVSFNVEHRIIRPGGATRVVHEQGEITYGKNGKPVRMLGTIHDITEKVKVIEELELYRMMIEKSADPVFLIDDDENCKMIFVNEAAVKHFGYDRDTILKWRIPDWDPNFTYEKLPEHVEEIKKVKNLMIESIHRTKDGEVPVEISLNMIYYKGHLCHFGYFKNISGRKKAQVELLEAKEAAETASFTKSEFLANISHEIRTPMNAILGFTEILQGMVTDETQKEYIKAISTSGKTLLTLINDILDLSKVEAGRIEIEKTVVNPHTIFNDMKMIFSQKIKEKGLDFIIDIDPDLPKAVMLDEIRLRQVLLNLVGNAVKFTDRGHIQLSVTSGGTLKGDKLINLIFAVEDTGVGIPEDQVQSIFSPFVQKKGQNYTQYGGTGLGLSITRKLVSLMDGELGVVSKPGEGSIFYVRLGGIEIYQGAVQKEELDTATIQFEPAKILVIDDIKGDRDLISGFLAPYEFTIEEAQSGQEGVEKALNMVPDLILMDMHISGMDGFTAIQEIRKHTELAKVPVVAVTASVISQSDEEINRVCDGYLRKPYSQKQLVEMIGRFLPYKHGELKSGPEPLEEKKRETFEYTLEVMQRLPEMLEKIESDLLPLWKDVSEVIIMDDIKEFCKQNHTLAQSYSFEPLLEWCGQLEKYCALYDTGEIRRILNEYPQEIQKAKELMNEHRK